MKNLVHISLPTDQAYIVITALNERMMKVGRRESAPLRAARDRVWEGIDRQLKKGTT